MGVGGQRHAPAAFPPWRDTVPILQEAGWTSEPVWIGAENLAPTGIRSPDIPAAASLSTDWAIPAPYFPFLQAVKFLPDDNLLCWNM